MSLFWYKSIKNCVVNKLFNSVIGLGYVQKCLIWKLRLCGKVFGNIEWHNILVLLSNGKGGWKKYHELLELENNHMIIFESCIVLS